MTGAPSADFAAASREAMIERSDRAAAAIREPIDPRSFSTRVPREAFCAPEYADLAYGDHPLPIEAGQTISQPYIVALMIQAAEIRRATGCSRSARARAMRRRSSAGSPAR